MLQGSAKKKYIAIWDNMNGTQGFYMESKKQNKPTCKTKRKTHSYRGQMDVGRGGVWNRWRGLKGTNLQL